MLYLLIKAEFVLGYFYFYFQFMALSMHSELMNIQQLGYLKGNQNTAMDFDIGRQFSLEKRIWVRWRWGLSWRSWLGSTEGMHTIWLPKTATIFAMMLVLDSLEIQSQAGLIGLLESVRASFDTLCFICFDLC